MFLSSFVVSPHPSLLLLFPPANSGSNETSIWPVRKTQTSLPLWEEEPRSCSGRNERNAGFQNLKTGRWWCSPRWICQSIAPWRAVLVWEEQVYRWGGKTGGGIKGNSTEPNVPKRLSEMDSEWWRSPPQDALQIRKMMLLIYGCCWKLLNSELICNPKNF